ncbi:putative selenium-dependent hydroxylase accessory protein YqeC [Desulfallas sp. Bu1-1]|uniref:selenium cofactor biosynthesis protein YqeC n=1 Tax=Desulfallas sp. Bu1-1 TaxID=2787620 RepID=UPI0018A0E874|nr:selenium cofactor biosynthesis protein YqeC [Desulfallas sp. Bu1-1]MBF7084714.1 putative selenium-dependent hydroxylase accessory protein YqeC [Desulfallas sp. Bu1-1]
MNLISEALVLQRKDLVVVVGAGGKTTIINRLAGELLDAGKKVVVSTTTKIFAPSTRNSVPVLLTDKLDDLQSSILNIISQTNYVIVGKNINYENKITGLSMEEVEKIHKINEVDFLLIEGDGAKNKPFKAPRSYEPVIPAIATLVVPVVGVECAGKPLIEDYFHAIDEICALTGLNYGDIVNEKVIAHIMLHPKGYKKNVPNHARWIPFINKVETKTGEKSALKLARILKEAGVDKIIIGSAMSNPPVKQIC